jgi:hypothetical protein
MTYPTLTRADTVTYVTGRFEGRLTDVDLNASAFNACGTSDYVDTVNNALGRVLTTWQDAGPADISAQSAKDGIEGELSVLLYEGLAALPGAVLTDKDFWRYCAAYLYDFIAWRQPSSKVVAFMTYFGAASGGLGRECVPHRMFDRAYIAKAGGDNVNADDPFEMAKFGAADMWKSHTLRVYNGLAPLVVHEYMSDVHSGALKIGDRVTREMITNLRRVRANVLFEVLDDHQARDLVDMETARARANEAARAAAPAGALDDASPDL